MARSDRLFQIIQILRGAARPVTAAALAAEIEVSKRTVYRDVAALVGQRVPIAGEAGLGYVLAAGYDMPPLMLTRDELEAVALGAQWVAGRADPALARAARDVVAKIAAAVPSHLRPAVLEPSVGAKPPSAPPDARLDLSPVRAAIREGRKLRLRYRSAAGAETERTVRPVILGHADAHCMLIVWCELREAFRHLRADRIVAAAVLPERTGEAPGALRRRWEAWRDEQLRAATPPRPAAARDGAPPVSPPAR